MTLLNQPRAGVLCVTAAHSADGLSGTDTQDAVAALIPIVRRIIGARASGTSPPPMTLMRVLAATERVEPGMREPHALVAARNLVASMWEAAAGQ